MKRGFFRIFVVISVSWVMFLLFLNDFYSKDVYEWRMFQSANKINQAVTDNLKTNGDFIGNSSNKSGIIQINNLSELFGELKNSVLKARKNGYNDEQIYYYLYIFTDYESRLFQYAGLSQEKKGIVYLYLGMKAPEKPLGQYIKLRVIKPSPFKNIIAPISIPLVLLWIMFYTSAWVAAGFKKTIIDN